MTSGAVDLQPRWASPPSRTIDLLLREAGHDRRDLQDLLSVDNRTARALFDDTIEITPSLASKMAQVLGSSPTFWTNRYQQYRDDLSRVEADLWARQAPREIFTTLGWVRGSGSWLDRINSLFEFFEVSDIDSWKSRYEPLLDQVLYRKHDSGKASDLAIAAWLRQAQIVARTLTTEQFNYEKLASVSFTARRLSRRKDPAEFIPALQEACRAAGVALVLLPHPTGCPISGATYITEAGSPLVVLSGRFLSDDHLWFTFLHELAHILLHGTSRVFLDSLDETNRGDTATHEIEANQWASQQVLSEKLVALAREQKRITTRFVARLARDSGFAPGVVVGQLQHLGVLKYSDLNKLKRWYRWNNGVLELKR